MKALISFIRAYNYENHDNANRKMGKRQESGNRGKKHTFLHVYIKNGQLDTLFHLSKTGESF